MAAPPRFCPRCGEEYVHTAERCVECDVPLTLEPPEATGSELPPAAELVCIRVASADWAVRLSERLRGADIAHRIEVIQGAAGGDARRAGAQLPWGVFVAEGDAERARHIDAQHLAAEIPDLEHADVAPAEEGACPACGDPVAADVEECPGCGLPFLPAE